MKFQSMEGSRLVPITCNLFKIVGKFYSSFKLNDIEFQYGEKYLKYVGKLECGRDSSRFYPLASVISAERNLRKKLASVCESCSL